MEAMKVLTPLVMMLGVLAIFNDHHNQAEGCDIIGLVKNCLQVVKKPGPMVPPSERCCGIVRNTDIDCVCSHMNRMVEKVVSMEKMAYVGRYCGLTIPPGTQCGSYIEPPAAAWAGSSQEVSKTTPSMTRPFETGTRNRVLTDSATAGLSLLQFLTADSCNLIPIRI